MLLGLVRRGGNAAGGSSTESPLPAAAGDGESGPITSLSVRLGMLPSASDDDDDDDDDTD